MVLRFCQVGLVAEGGWLVPAGEGRGGWPVLVSRLVVGWPRGVVCSLCGVDRGVWFRGVWLFELGAWGDRGVWLATVCGQPRSVTLRRGVLGLPNIVWSHWFTNQICFRSI